MFRLLSSLKRRYFQHISPTILTCLLYMCNCIFNKEYYNKTKEREALRKQGLNEKTAASVLLKLFISRNEGCYTTDAP